MDEDRLDSISGPGVDIGYTYDADGRKVKETLPDTVRQFLVDRLLPYGQVILETDGAGDMVTEYSYGLERISQERGGITHWYLADAQGSVRQLADSNGFISDSYAYTAFGEPLASTGLTANEFRYVGEQVDPISGLYYLRARWMNPNASRFASVDPYKGRIGKPISQHRYIYADQSPINKFDPTGMMSLIDVTFAAPQAQRLRAIQVSTSANTTRWLMTRLVVGAITTSAAAKGTWDWTRQLNWLFEARKEGPIRLQHYTTENGKVHIEGSGIIMAPNGTNFFSPFFYSSSEEAGNRNATPQLPDFYVSLNLYRNADKLFGWREVEPKIWWLDGQPIFREGGGREYWNHQQVYINGLMRARTPFIPLTD